MVRPFQIGDRVRARTLSSVPTGTLGRIARTLMSAPDRYFVQFDGYEHWGMMHASDLELVIDVPADEEAS